MTRGPPQAWEDSSRGWEGPSQTWEGPSQAGFWRESCQVLGSGQSGYFKGLPFYAGEGQECPPPPK